MGNPAPLPTRPALLVAEPGEICFLPWPPDETERTGAVAGSRSRR